MKDKKYRNQLMERDYAKYSRLYYIFKSVHICSTCNTIHMSVERTAVKPWPTAGGISMQCDCNSTLLVLTADIMNP